MSPALLSAEVITLLGGRLFFGGGCITAKSFAKLDRVALCARQLLHDLDEPIIRFVWIHSPLETDLVRKDGVCVEVKVDCVIIIGLNETGTNIRI